MTVGGPPDKLSGRHMLMALMHAAGWTNRRIAAELGMNENRISIIRSSPLFQAEVKKLQREMATSTVSEVVERIALESGRSLDTVLELRDHAENENVRLNSALAVLDRNPETARRSKTEEERTLRIVFQAADIARMTAVAAEVEGAPAPVAALNDGEPRIAARTLDDALEALRGDAP